MNSCYYCYSNVVTFEIPKEHILKFANLNGSANVRARKIEGLPSNQTHVSITFCVACRRASDTTDLKKISQLKPQTIAEPFVGETRVIDTVNTINNNNFKPAISLNEPGQMLNAAKNAEDEQENIYVIDPNDIAKKRTVLTNAEKKVWWFLQGYGKRFYPFRVNWEGFKNTLNNTKPTGNSCYHFLSVDSNIGNFFDGERLLAPGKICVSLVINSGNPITVTKDKQGNAIPLMTQSYAIYPIHEVALREITNWIIHAFEYIFQDKKFNFAKTEGVFSLISQTDNPNYQIEWFPVFQDVTGEKWFINQSRKGSAFKIIQVEPKLFDYKEEYYTEFAKNHPGFYEVVKLTQILFYALERAKSDFFPCEWRDIPALVMKVADKENIQNWDSTTIGTIMVSLLRAMGTIHMFQIHTDHESMLEDLKNLTAFLA
jgi:L-rhamnose mutarotase